MLDGITQDKFWGFVLIGLGVLALTFRPFDKVNGYLQGSADKVLTSMCLVLAGVLVLIALSDKPALKALAVFWVVTP